MILMQLVYKLEFKGHWLQLTRAIPDPFLDMTHHVSNTKQRMGTMW